MKVLFLGDASNFHNTLATELRRMGHQAIVASAGSRWMNTPRDINLYRRPGLSGAISYALKILRHLPDMRGYDVVQLCGAIFLELKPEKILPLVSYLRKHNGKIVLNAVGTDCTYYNACHDGHTYRYSDYFIGNEPSPYYHSAEYHAQQQDNWKTDRMQEYHQKLLNRVDGVIACLWEYYKAYESIGFPKLGYGGIPIDLSTVPAPELKPIPERIKFLIGIQRDRTVIKGTDRLLKAARSVVAANSEHAELTVVENLPFAEYVKILAEHHVLLDQLYSYTPATNALLAMARGLIAVSGAENEYYDFIGETINKPIVNVEPTIPGHIEQQLQSIIHRREQLPKWQVLNHQFVAKHNASTIVAQRHLDFWKKI